MIDENLLLEIVTHQDWQFPLDYPLVLDFKDIEDWGLFQSYLKLTQYINQDGKCLCGLPLEQDGELHHALISRKDVMGWQQPWLIHSSFNVVVLHHNCHKKVTRQEGYKFLCSIFGDKVKNWYREVSLNVKSKLNDEFLS